MPRSLSASVGAVVLAAALHAGCAAKPAEAPAPTPASEPARKPVPELTSLTEASASNFAQLALKCVQKIYPNQPQLILGKAADVLSPEKAHPAFYGCYDWHSSVHGHWMLARVLRMFPSLAEAPQIKNALTENLSAKNIAVEAAYFNRPDAKAFERMNGWAWSLKLAEELNRGESAEAKSWAANVKPLADTLVARYLDFLPKQVYPIRTGLHPNTAFGLAFALDYANSVNDAKLKELLIARSNDYFAKDTDYPAKLEPGGSDFLSPALMEADLMQRVMPPDQFTTWFRAFLPGIAKGEPKNLLEIAIVSDRTDPQLGHLDGLNLSRAWSMRHIAAKLPAGDPARAALEESAFTHATDALKNVASGHYEGEHWLGSFAVYLLTEPK
ncbi:MAG: DUF2891 domain-containing protein [Acidimicrobiia bacterium]